jgi:2,3-bisphosphoglycerate-independent phosphoglycerate mutase
MPATIQAIEHTDAALQRIITEARRLHAGVLITADHGNAECLFDEKIKQPCTAHTTNPVPVLCMSDELKLKEGALADVAPTILTMLGLPVPPFMTGTSLFL